MTLVASTQIVLWIWGLGSHQAGEVACVSVVVFGNGNLRIVVYSASEVGV